MTDRQLDMKICRIMGWTYQKGWAFATTGNKENVTGKLAETREKIKAILCLSCNKPIGNYEWSEVSTLARFGQMLFEHKNCTEVE